MYAIRSYYVTNLLLINKVCINQILINLSDEMGYDTKGQKMTKDEMETIVNFTEADDIAYIYTYNVVLKNRLAKYSVKYPHLCKLTAQTDDGSRTYEVPKKRLTIMLTAPMSERNNFV